MPSSKRRMIAMAGAALWLVVASTAFTILSLAMIGTSVARFALAGIAIAGVVYLVIGVGVIRAVLRSPGAIPPRTSEERVMMRRFIWVVIAEVVAIMVANTICAVTQHVDAIVPVDVLIVGIHFLPLAWLFRVPRYYTMGALFSVVNVLTLVLFPASARIGAATVWFVLPALGCTPVAWATAGLNLREARRSIHENQSTTP